MASSRDKGRHKMNIRKDDIVQVMVGKDKGKRGKVLEVFPKRGLAIVEKANMVKRHTRPSQRQRQGGIIEKESKIQISNLMLVCPKTGEPSRVGRKVLEDGRKVRFMKKSGEMLDVG
jgi:large subunit ribosomal protein L24